MNERAIFRNGLTGYHVLLFVCAFFGVIFAVSATFAYYALSTYPGEESNAYARGLHYNETLARAAQIEARGWHRSVRYRDGRITVTLADKHGKPVAAQNVDVQLRRPATNRFDTIAKLQEQTPGTYAAAVPLDEGSWDAVVRVGDAGTHDLFSETVRIWSSARS